MINPFPDSIPKHTPSWEAFILLLSDLEASFRYVQPNTSHLNVYSLRYYEFLLRSCTEFESICKDKLIELSLSTKDPDNYNLIDYWKLAEPLDVVEYAVIYNFHEYYRTQPLAAWKTTHKLSWYDDYNEVKHNRNGKFERASLKNVLDAMGALFILITKCELCPTTVIKWSHSIGTVHTVENSNLIMRKSLKPSKP